MTDKETTAGFLQYHSLSLLIPLSHATVSGEVWVLSDISGATNTHGVMEGHLLFLAKGH